ncbi:MAG TPA: HAD family hydrolase [Roseiflexaceae bacterium]|nr:HAD family hydrolase [Roseiflexaceae bacterium]
MAIRGVLLDVDGTLIDSNDAHARSWVETLAEFGYELPFERLRELIGMGGDHLLPEATGLEKDSSQGKAISERRKQLFKERYLSQIQPFAQVRPLLAHMRGAGMRLVVATSASPDELEALLERSGAQDLIEASTSSGDAKRSKPDPDIVGAALERLDLPKETVLMLGDTPYDVEAARRAGIGIVALRCGGWGDDDLGGALAIYDDPADLLAHFGESPFANSGG